ncbi:MAG: hypothetical protein H6624_12340 [Bdellovibrionaceae bacterium]|nr:hypothetical protein [Bdellovibrionales bacterium]MCB9085132.1 hypothetical protein [Pseudobdellovibrionaceae bacterium]
MVTKVTYGRPGVMIVWAVGLSIVLQVAPVAEAKRTIRRPANQHSQFNPKAYKTKLALALAKKAYKANGHIPRNFKILSINKTTVDYYYTHGRIGYICTNSHDSLMDLSERPICTSLGDLVGIEDLNKGKIHRFYRNPNGSYDIILGEFALEQFKCKVFPGNQVVQACSPWNKIDLVSQ